MLLVSNRILVLYRMFKKTVHIIHFHSDMWHSGASSCSGMWFWIGCDLFKAQINWMNLPGTELCISCISGSLAGLESWNHSQCMVHIPSFLRHKVFFPRRKGLWLGVQRISQHLHQLWLIMQISGGGSSASLAEVAPQPWPSSLPWEWRWGWSSPNRAKDRSWSIRTVGDLRAVSVVFCIVDRGWNLGKDSSSLSVESASLGVHVSVQPLDSPELRGRKTENRDWLYVSRPLPPSLVGLG